MLQGGGSRSAAAADAAQPLSSASSRRLPIPSSVRATDVRFMLAGEKVAVVVSRMGLVVQAGGLVGTRARVVVVVLRPDQDSALQLVVRGHLVASHRSVAVALSSMIMNVGRFPGFVYGPKGSFAGSTLRVLLRRAWLDSPANSEVAERGGPPRTGAFPSLRNQKT